MTLLHSPRCCRRAQIEALEARQLMSMTPTMFTPIAGGCGCAACAAALSQASAVNASAVTASASGFKLDVDFQPASTTTVAPGFRADLGRTYGVRGNGKTYGWNVDNSANTVDRRRSDVSRNLNTFIKTTTARTWEAQVPNGTYRVHIVSGDPSSIDSDYRFSVEGQPLSTGTPKTGHNYIEGVIPVKVSDGRITITTDDRSVNANINYIEIRKIVPQAAAKQGEAIRWRQATTMDTVMGRVEAGVVHIGTKIFIFGGYFNGYEDVTGRMDVYDTTTNKYKRLASLPGAQSHWGVATDEKFIYLVAGQQGGGFASGTNQAWKYEIATNKWSSFVNLPAVRYGGSMAQVGNKLHFFGGSDATRVQATDNHWVLDLAKQSAGWKVARPLPLATDHMGVTVARGKIYLMGGEIDHGVSYLGRDQVFAYDPNTDTYQQKASMPTPASHFEGNVVYDGSRIFVLGGQNNAQRWSDEVRSYDFVSDEWSVHTPMPVTRKAGISWTTKGRLYYTAGEQTGAGEPKSTYVGVFL